MAKQVIGDACAYIPNASGNSTYRKIGTAFRDGERLSVKIDTLPLPSSGWEGWVNIFPDTRRETPRQRQESPDDITPGDIPF